MLQIGQIVEVNTMIEPESEFWEKGYWQIPRGYKAEIQDVNEDGDCLIEYIGAGFYVDSKFLNAL